MENIVTKGWGYELWIVNNDLYCCKRLCVLPKKTCSLHYHQNKKETFYILDGELSLTVIHKSLQHTINLTKGQSYTINTNIPHKFTTNKDYPCDFIEISTHHEDSDSYRIEKGD